jgi:hypothetical protein
MSTRRGQICAHEAADCKRILPPSVARDSIRLPCVYYFFLAVVVIRYETTATARWALLFIVRAFFNDTITVAVWTGFHVRLMEMLHTPAIIFVGALLIRL